VDGACRPRRDRSVSRQPRGQFWGVPDGAEIIAAPGASALIARLPTLLTGARVSIEGPTYNEHAASFRTADGPSCGGGADDASVACIPTTPMAGA
jgi:cobalamin biosynthetic protein CobC